MAQIKYPISFTNGAIDLTEDEPTKVSEALRHLLQTQIADRLWYPEYGYSPELFQPRQTVTTEVEILKMIIKEYMVDYDFILRQLTGRIDENGRLKLTVVYSVNGDEYTEVSS